MENECLRLFKALFVKDNKKANPIKKIHAKTIKNGYILSGEIYANYNESELEVLIKIIEKELVLTSKQYNQTFHKSWQKIRDASIEQLVIEQIFHYITTYGYEALGIYDENYVYIPAEKLNVPNLKINKINLLVIKGYTEDELKDKIFDLLKSGIALKSETINDIIEIIRNIGIDENEISGIKNKEIRIILYDQFNILPKNEVEFLRYLIYKITGKSLLIKDKATIEQIKDSDIDCYAYFNNYNKQYGFENLSKIFYRFKPLFLALKGKGSINKIINKIRKLAVKHHEPMAEDYLNSVTKNINNIDAVKLREELDKVNVFRKSRLAYALKYRTIEDVDSVMYRIRNGKSWATDFDFNNQDKASEVLDIVCKSITNGNFKNKKIYFPNNIDYALPITEKQFVGNVPSGTCIKAEKNMIIGIHWKNIKGHRIDLDFSMINANGKFGWDGYYRNEGRTILFSGDITDAPHGATEAFYVKTQKKGNYLLCVNYYNYEENIDVPFTIFTASEKIDRFGTNYIVNPNNIICNMNTVINQKQQIIGLLNIEEDNTNFYVTNANIGKSITVSGNDYIDKSRRYLFNFYKNIITLREVFYKNVTDDKENCDIDLSYENLERDTIINLLK